MKIEKNVNGSELVIKLDGRLDTNTSPELEQEIQELAGVESLIFDFGKLEYISSAGLRILLNCQKKMNGQGNMVIKHANEDMKDVFEITGFSDILTIV